MKIQRGFLSLVLLLGLARTADAETFGGRLGSVGAPCSGGCSDVYKVSCAHPDTHQIRAIVRSAFQSDDTFEVMLVGFTGPSALHGRADRDVSPAPGGFDFSPPVFLTRAPGSHGATKALIEVAQATTTFLPVNGYAIVVQCLDEAGNDLDGFRFDDPGRPRLTPLQDQ